ncbi:MAG: hypothetical protein ACREFW_10620 [Rhizomicrobium sp.]
MRDMLAALDGRETLIIDVLKVGSHLGGKVDAFDGADLGKVKPAEDYCNRTVALNSPA